jgi:hypothetical protein
MLQLQPLQLVFVAVFAAFGSAITLLGAGAAAVIYVDKQVGKVRGDVAKLREELLGSDGPFRRVTECDALRHAGPCDVRPVHLHRNAAEA